MSTEEDSIARFIVAKSDQLNADDLVAGPITVRIHGARVTGGAEQPVTVDIGPDHRPWKPCKTSMRVLAALWSERPSEWVGRSIRLYRDPTVKYGGVEVGGIRINGMSHIDGAKRITLAASKKAKVEHRIDVLRVDEPKPAPQPAAQTHAPSDPLGIIRGRLKAIGATMTDLMEFATQVTGKDIGPPDTWTQAQAEFIAKKLCNGWGTQLAEYVSKPTHDDHDMPE